MPRTIVDLDSLDLTATPVSEEQLRHYVPHDFEFRMVDAICHLDLEQGIVVGYKDWAADAWWARGHIPGRPLMPGVLMIESAAQVSTVLMKMQGSWDPERFIGLAGVNSVRFRGTVVPPCRIYLASIIGSMSSRIAKYPAQAFVDGKLVMDMELLGALL